ncbi:MAG: UDP-2,3-diacylglucosamine diphosphatase [Cyclobacterium sp.]|uniref:UDP-2,3-diacylglucosamine diphosphatase n=1 Tax=unclassified Cyclobacterium TaxID=2615055 RepID=UPI0013D3E030|nr:UDP-2,3-diacylglucosamine diphosphatase [Cyclobacterium sp. SYSU L10401]
MKIRLAKGQKVYFVSDFHLGTPDPESSRQREEKIVKWLGEIEEDAAAIFFVGDIFDFWFEYDKVIPKGFLRFLSKITLLRAKGTPLFFFTGNHDLWMKDYFTGELDIPVYHNPLSMEINGKKFLVGHGDGLGPGDRKYKLLKKFFTSKYCQWLFKWIHPDIGISIAQSWSKNSRITNDLKQEDEFKGKEKEWLYQYCLEMENKMHFDYYIFGHRHLPLNLPLNGDATYFNLGEWVNQCYFGEFDGEAFHLRQYNGYALKSK